MNQELNSNNLKEAITRLPIYAPPNTIWAQIDYELNLQKGIQQLPQHQPSDLVWQVIETDLVKSVRVVKPSSTKWSFWINKLSIAAAVLLLIGTSWWIFSTTITPNQLSYSQEIINAQLLTEDWEEDSEALAQIEAICQLNNYACTATEFQSLEEELKELNEAKLTLTQAIENFGKDTQLIAKLSEVELERTAVLKKMIANIL